MRGNKSPLPRPYVYHYFYFCPYPVPHLTLALILAHIPILTLTHYPDSYPFKRLLPLTLPLPSPLDAQGKCLLHHELVSTQSQWFILSFPGFFLQCEADPGAIWLAGLLVKVGRSYHLWSITVRKARHVVVKALWWHTV